MKKLVVCGGGFAGHMTALALSNGLGSGFQVILLPDVAESVADVFYGGVSTPGAYEFFRGLGLDEPTLIQDTSTGFSYGTKYSDWPGASSDWVQCHHLPLPTLGGVPFQHALTQQNAELQSLLVSAVAAEQGRFAHPPDDARIPLSRAEYGYQFSISEVTDLLRRRVSESRVEIQKGKIESVSASGGQISEIVLDSGTRISGSLFFDCSGPERILMTALNGGFHADRRVTFAFSQETAVSAGPPYRSVKAKDAGWTSTTHLQDRTERLEVSGADPNGHQVSLGSLQEAWRGNCVAIGQTAVAMEPLTPAPILLLQADIERFLELVPVQSEVAVERKEYNRRFHDDVSHARLFQNALFRSEETGLTPYWEEAIQGAASEALNRKITQFEHRGLLVKYDLEPFNDEDWLILHNGIGRKPNRYDRQIENVPKTETEKQLLGLQRAIQQIVSRMPPHHQYIQNMKRYLENQKHG